MADMDVVATDWKDQTCGAFGGEDFHTDQNLVQSSTRWQHVSNFIEHGVRALESVGSCGR